MATITLEQLEQYKACEGQRLWFKRRFGKSVKLTRELCQRLATDESRARWAIRCLLSFSNQKRAEKLEMPALLRDEAAGHTKESCREFYQALALIFFKLYTGQEATKRGKRKKR